MSAFYEFYINETKYPPLNIGGITLEYTRERESGSYQYVKTLGSSVSFDDSEGAYSYILSQGECQKISLSIKEFCDDFPDGIVVFSGKFTRRDCKFDPTKSMVDVTPKQDSLYQCVLDNYDRKFNMLEVPTVVSSTYAIDASRYEYEGKSNQNSLPFFGDAIETSGGSSPLIGIGLFAREEVTTYCQGGQPQPPPQGAGVQWQLLTNNCEGAGVSTWFRIPIAFQPPAVDSVLFVLTICAGTGCTPPTPPVGPNNEDWIYMGSDGTAGFGVASFWFDMNTVDKNLVEINNGRLLTEVINHGLNQYEGCESLALQSQLLFNETNPVTGVSPSPLYELQVHAIDDVKDPDATLPGTIENVTLKGLMSDIIEGKLNAFWRVNEGTQRFIVEHINDLNNQGVIDLTAIDGGEYTYLKDKYTYDNTDVPKAEEFPSLDTSLDFTGVDIVYNNDCSSGVKTYTTGEVYTEVQSIVLDPDTYPNDGIVLITPDSLAPPGMLDSNDEPIGTRSENGFLTGDYRPNAPMAMANLHNTMWGYYRPFIAGNMNFTNVVFDKARPVKQNEEITVPICCFFSFEPTSAFIGNNFTEGQLISSSYNLGTRNMTLNLEY